MQLLIGVLIAAPIVLALVALTRTRKQSEYDEEAKEENRRRQAQIESDRAGRMEAYAISWKRRGLLEQRPVAIQPFKPRLVASEASRLRQ